MAQETRYHAMTRFCFRTLRKTGTDCLLNVTFHFYHPSRLRTETRHTKMLLESTGLTIYEIDQGRQNYCYFASVVLPGLRFYATVNGFIGMVTA
ncbi:hypothetical protein BJ508DRAFT_76330 [Ascobolus immersus RN42]|uniref:Uncharacterized protein n=1 Tax=Ascobolus immersus RN42 TaxID=1160509 RepID=A0A3N4HGW7_ASCIM|nr:hypothetical protein BJ508DRAFT_76330 [Ascobolus immersus RN42]